jgi:hypothetical protein
MTICWIWRLLFLKIISIGAEFYSQALPTGMKYGSWYQVSIEYQNTGTLPWEPGMVRLVNATGGDFGVNDVPLKYKVGAGGVASFSFNVKIECRSYLSFPFFFMRRSIAGNFMDTRFE